MLLAIVVVVAIVEEEEARPWSTTTGVQAAAIKKEMRLCDEGIPGSVKGAPAGRP
jgi:hypothetical protein